MQALNALMYMEHQNNKCTYCQLFAVGDLPSCPWKLDLAYRQLQQDSYSDTSKYGKKYIRCCFSVHLLFSSHFPLPLRKAVADRHILLEIKLKGHPWWRSG